MTVPAHFGGGLPGVVLDRRGSAGTGQRHGLSALGRCSQDEQGANGGKPENFSHLHIDISLESSDLVIGFTPAPIG
jgi:hypothetical protein